MEREYVLKNIIELGNTNHPNMKMVEAIEKYMERYLNDKILDYELLFRFILMEHNCYVSGYDFCTKYLNFIIDNTDDLKYKTYAAIYLFDFENHWCGVQRKIFKLIDELLDVVEDKHLRSLLYLEKALAIPYNESPEEEKKLLLTSIDEDPNIFRSYFCLAHFYNNNGNKILAEEYLKMSIEKIVRVVEGKDSTDIEAFIDELAGCSLDRFLYNQITDKNYLK